MLVDIEGTTTPVSFVYDVLFPFARRRVRAFLQRRSGEPAVRADLEALRREYEVDRTGSDPPPPWAEPGARTAGAAAYIEWLIDRDRKSTGLKSLQGRIWEEGFQAGELRGMVYPDVPPAFERWHREGRGPWIFSSGSVLAQKLLFAHSDAGDLTPLIAGYFDTTIGPKKEAASYGRIAESIGLAPPEVLFVSDVAAELDAARDAGMRTRLCVREGPAPAASAHPVVGNFDGL
jgi:enolase-phosphatase E1